MVNRADSSQCDSPRRAFYAQCLSSPKSVFNVVRDLMSPGQKYTPGDLSNREIIKINVMAAAYFLYTLAAIPFVSDVDAQFLYSDLKGRLSPPPSNMPPPTHTMQ
jgi:hypothetical protein